MSHLPEDWEAIDPRNVTSWLADLLVRTGGNRDISNETAHMLFHNLTKLIIKKQLNVNSSWKTLLETPPDDELWKENRRVSYVTYCVLITLYSLVIAAGSLGNGLVILSVVRKPTMRTLRNAFVTNLAVSDTLLCLVTAPLTLLEIISKYWPLGNSPISCKMAGGMQAVSIFVSTYSITAISLDRFQLIVYPTGRDYLKQIGAAASLIFIWIFGIILALPIFLFRYLDHHVLLPDGNGGIESVDYCYEEWPISNGRAIYSIVSIVVQYAVPILIVSVAHARICRRLQNRPSSRGTQQPASARNAPTSTADSAKHATERKRLRRLSTLLLSIAFVFAICWMPLNIFNLVMDLCPTLLNKQEEQETMLIIYAVCHLLSMSSACANPFLYGWFNDNFRREFADIFAAILRFCGRTKRVSSARAPLDGAVFAAVDNRCQESILRASQPVLRSDAIQSLMPTHAVPFTMTLATNDCSKAAYADAKEGTVPNAATV